jgi:hypothetical protein
MPYSLVQGILEINQGTIMRRVACIKTMCVGVFCHIRILFTLRYNESDAVCMDPLLCNVRCGRLDWKKIVEHW